MYSIYPKMSEFFCTACDLQLANVHSYQAHLKTKRHHRKVNNVGFEYPCCCSKVYKSRQARYLHRVKCNVYQEFKKKKLANSTTATSTTSSTVENHDINRILELEKDAKIKEKDARIKELEFKLEIAELKEKIANTTKVTNNYNSKNKTINNINVTINAFGEEKIDYITDQKKIEYCKEVYESFKCYLTDVHFNPDHPENQNVKLQNKRQNMCLIMQNNKWKYIPKDMLYDQMKSTAYDALSGTYYEYKSKFEQIKQYRFEEFVKKYNSEKTNKAIHKKIDKEIDILFLEAKNNLN
jgi:hypothetical protein